MGISEAALDKVFEYFEQTESGRNSKSGTGLGLAISRDFAHAMGGDITVTSAKNEGSAFRLETRVFSALWTSISLRTSTDTLAGLA